VSSDAPAPGLLARHGDVLLRVAARSIDRGLESHGPLPIDVQAYPPELRASRAAFVTLKRNGQLRGCIGSTRAHRPLIQDVAINARAAAFRDPRFKPLTPEENRGLAISLAVLAPPQPMTVATEDDLLTQLRPGVDGLILHHGGARAVFLPVVWRSFPEPRDFFRQLKDKAGLAPDAWSAEFRLARFTTEETGMSDSGDTPPKLQKKL
jgi:AmmeMemoRadiSam system protein A